LIRAYDTLLDRFQEDPQKLQRLIGRGHVDEAAALASTSPLLISEAAASFSSTTTDSAFLVFCRLALTHDLSPALPTLLGALGNRDPEMRRHSATILGISAKTTDLHSALPFLFGLMKDPDLGVREAAINSLAECTLSLKNSNQAEAILVDALAHASPISEGAATAILLAIEKGNLNLRYRLEGSIFNYHFPPRWE
jgi:HEAT repeat protein